MEFEFDEKLLEKIKDENFNFNFGTKISFNNRSKSFFVEVTNVKNKESELYYPLTKEEYYELFAYYKKARK